MCAWYIQIRWEKNWLVAKDRLDKLKKKQKNEMNEKVMDFIAFKLFLRLFITNYIYSLTVFFKHDTMTVTRGAFMMDGESLRIAVMQGVLPPLWRKNNGDAFGVDQTWTKSPRINNIIRNISALLQRCWILLSCVISNLTRGNGAFDLVACGLNLQGVIRWLIKRLWKPRPGLNVMWNEF